MTTTSTTMAYSCVESETDKANNQSDLVEEIGNTCGGS